MLGDFNPDIILSDHSLPSFDSIPGAGNFKGKEDRYPIYIDHCNHVGGICSRYYEAGRVRLYP